MKSLPELSNYYLLLELMNDGEAGLAPEIEPINQADIFETLRLRTGLDLENDKHAWCKWFLGSQDAGSELERANLMIFLKTQRKMEEILNWVSKE